MELFVSTRNFLVVFRCPDTTLKFRLWIKPWIVFSEYNPAISKKLLLPLELCNGSEKPNRNAEKLANESAFTCEPVYLVYWMNLFGEGACRMRIHYPVRWTSNSSDSNFVNSKICRSTMWLADLFARSQQKLERIEKQKSKIEMFPRFLLHWFIF